MTKDDQIQRLHKSLTNLAPSQEQIVRIEAIRHWARNFGASIIDNSPQSREQSLALTHLEDSVMWAVKSILLEEG